MNLTPRVDFIEKYARRNIAKGMAQEIIETAEPLRK